MDSSLEQLPAEANLVLVLVNPRAGSGAGRDLVHRLVELLRQAGFCVQVETDVNRLVARSETACQSGPGSLRAVVAAGGDGTVGLLVNRLASGIPIVILPLGTENLLAKYLGVTADPADLCQTIRAGWTTRLDAGRAGDRIFLLMLGCGFDAEVVRRLHEGRRGNIRHLSYAKPILDSLRNYQYPGLRVYSEAGEGISASSRQIEAHWVFVVNLPRYAGGLSLVPDAKGTDGLLDLCTFKQGSIWHGLRYLGGVLIGRHQSWDDCVTVQTRRLRIESDELVPYQLDGDPGGYLPVDVEVLPHRLTVLVSRTNYVGALR